MPVLLAGLEPDDVSGPDLVDRSVFALHQPAATSDDQRLAQRMSVPRGAGARLERDGVARRARGAVPGRTGQSGRCR